MRILITGAGGSGARYLIDWIKANHPEVEIHGAVRKANSRSKIEGVRFHEVDLLDQGSIFRCLCHAAPRYIFHLAANPDKCFDVPVAAFMNNAVGSLNLFEAVRTYANVSRNEISTPTIINVSSSEVYGEVKPEEIPIKEDNPKRPVSPYAVAKLTQDNLASVYFQAYQLPIITTRSFSYNNFYRRNLFTSDFAYQIAKIEVGEQEVLRHGNLNSIRVLCDARDIAEAYWLCAAKCYPGEAYNIGGGEQVAVGEILQKLINLSGRSIPCVSDSALFRPVDVTLQVPDCSKFKNATGWEPKFDLDQSLKDLLNHWRKEVRKEANK